MLTKDYLVFFYHFLRVPVNTSPYKPLYNVFNSSIYLKDTHTRRTTYFAYP